jgi:hypothetical protein
MNVSKDEAAAALVSVRAASLAARSAFRAHHGHYHLWLWGAVWIVMSLLAHLRGFDGIRLFPWISAAGIATSCVIGFLQSGQVRSPVDGRYFGALAAIVGFAAIAPFALGIRAISPEASFAYIALVTAQAYVVTGLWFDTYMVWFGLLLAALVLIGLLVFTSIFWIWTAVFAGGAYIATGFYVRYFWR